MTFVTSRQVSTAGDWQPVTGDERYQLIDVVRGIALFGVLLVNLLTLFRVSLFEHMLTFHTHPGRANEIVDIIVDRFFQFKAFAVFSFLFGVGIGIQAERAARRGVNVKRFLLRRFLVLLMFGLIHLLLIWDGDILTLYAVCGLLIVPLLGRPTWFLAVLGIAIFLLRMVVDLPIPFPSEAAIRAQAIAAAQVYSTGNYIDILIFRWHETTGFIGWLLLGVLPRTFGLMLCGVALWRLHIIPPVRIPFTSYLAAAGQMALTNYLMQSIVLGFIFYGYGLGLFGRLSPVEGTSMAIVFFALQLVFSRLWLKHHRFGPFERLWRRLTYGSIA